MKKEKTDRVIPAPLNIPVEKLHDPIIVKGEGLTIEEVMRVARHGDAVRITEEESILGRIRASSDYIIKSVEAGEPIYGVTTGFGGMANITIPKEEATELQNNLVWFLKTGAGNLLPASEVRATMLLRVNSLMRGVSGIRLEIIQRLETFLNAGVIPHVREFGSIGASGDLVPLAAIAGALVGTDSSFKVDYQGKEVDSITALKRLGLSRLRLAPKEGLALVNGTSAMTGIAAHSAYDALELLALSMGAHALMMQGLYADNQTFHPFIHSNKPHPGQILTARLMLDLLSGSRLIRDDIQEEGFHHKQELAQDRYSLRCLPQFMGPVIDGFAQVYRQIETEMNSATDNPLIDPDAQTTYHCGNFLGQYIGIALDQLRHYIGLTAKHLDVQIALLTTPEFSHGLSPSLVGQTSRKVNMGLKGLQITGNSIMPLLTFLGAPLADRFPTHAEQYNQNINSLGFGSATLSRQSIRLFQQYMSIALMFGIQAVDLRTHAIAKHYDARKCLSPESSILYTAIHDVIGRSPSANRPYIWNDNEQALDEHIAMIAADIAKGGRISKAVNKTVLGIKSFISSQ